MKHIFTALLFVACLPISAQHMLIEKSGNNNEIVELGKLKKITFDGTTVNIEQTDGTRSSSAMGDIGHIYFGDYTSIDEVKPIEREFIRYMNILTEMGYSNVRGYLWYISKNEIAINCPAGTLITVYDVIGSQVISTRLGGDGDTINIAGLPKGIYIVKANDKTAKIIKR